MRIERLLNRFVIVLLLNTAFMANGQSSKEVRRYMELGTQAFQQNDFHTALDYYLKASAISPQDPGVAYSVALCYHETGQGAAALPYLELAIKGGISDPMLPYYYGVSLHLHHKFDEAITQLTSFKAQKGLDKYYYGQADRVIAWCNTGKVLIKNEEKVLISNLGPNVNSSYPDYNPVLSADEDELLYTSRRSGGVGTELFPGDQLPYEDLYAASKDKGQWLPSINLGTSVNTKSHDACVGLSADGQTLLLYKTEAGQEFGDLYISYLQGTTWSSPKALTAVNSPAWEPCGTLSADGKYLLFVSNRKGGVGGTDLYLATKQADGSYANPVLLAGKANTVHNEFSPYLHPDGTTLYFSSDGPNAIGGYDIFSCKVDLAAGLVKSDPVNLGYPINTADDEAFFVWSADGKRAYFSSVRAGGYGEKDLYILQREEVKQEVALVMLKGRVHDCKDKKPLQAEITVSDNVANATLGTYVSNGSTGKYLVMLPAGRDYGIAVSAPGYAFYSKNIDIPDLSHYQELDDEVCLNSIKTGTTFILNNVFFDVNTATLRPESRVELERVYSILKNNETIKVEISGHTDSNGEEHHNQKLSEHRAHAVREYLIDRGIDGGRISFKGYGESNPIAPNDTPEHMQLNRRTEMKIVE